MYREQPIRWIESRHLIKNVIDLICILPVARDFAQITKLHLRVVDHIRWAKEVKPVIKPAQW